MLIIPHDSTLHLCRGVELDPNYEYTIDFETRDKQREYFTSKQLTWFHENEGYSHIRVNESIRVDVNISDILNCNYVYFTNDNVGVPKTFYAFITSKEYINDDTTQLNLKLDVMQTFMFDYELGECFVEREHQDRWTKNRDAIFNIESEDLDYGNEYSTFDEVVSPTENVTDRLYFAYCSIDTSSPDVSISYYNGQVLANTILVYPFIRGVNTFETPPYDIQVTIKNDTLEGGYETQSIDPDIGLWAVNEYARQIVISAIPPSGFTIKRTGSLITMVQNEDNKSIYLFKKKTQDNKYGIEIFDQKDLRPSTIKAFTRPTISKLYNHNSTRSVGRESKLLTYPYNFYKLIFGNQEINVKNEYMSKSLPTHAVCYQSLSNEGSIVMGVTNYKGGNPFSLRPSLANVVTNQLPIYSDLRTTAWQKYMLDNKNQRISGYINQAVGAVSGIGTGIASNRLMGDLAGFGVIGAVQQGVSAFTGITSQIAKEKDIKNQLNDAKVFNGDNGATYFISDNKPVCTEYTLQESVYNRIDNYFYHYGYKCNDFKVPNIKSRYYFNFIKCSDVVLITDIATDYINEIKEIYKKGITFWHYRADYKGVNTYDYENAEMSIEEANA